MSDHFPINHYGEALSALEAADEGAALLDAKDGALYYALLAAAQASLAAHDASLVVREELIATQARLRELRDK